MKRKKIEREGERGKEYRDKVAGPLSMTICRLSEYRYHFFVPITWNRVEFMHRVDARRDGARVYAHTHTHKVDATEEFARVERLDLARSLRSRQDDATEDGSVVFDPHCATQAGEGKSRHASFRR